MKKLSLIGFIVLALLAVASCGLGGSFLFGEIMDGARLSDGEPWSSAEGGPYTIWSLTTCSNQDTIELLENDQPVGMARNYGTMTITLNTTSYAPYADFNAQPGVTYTLSTTTNSVLIRKSTGNKLAYGAIAMAGGGLLAVLSIVPLTLFIISLFSKKPPATPHGV